MLLTRHYLEIKAIEEESLGLDTVAMISKWRWLYSQRSLVDHATFLVGVIKPRPQLAAACAFTCVLWCGVFGCQ